MGEFILSSISVRMVEVGRTTRYECIRLIGVCHLQFKMLYNNVGCYIIRAMAFL